MASNPQAVSHSLDAGQVPLIVFSILLMVVTFVVTVLRICGTIIRSRRVFVEDGQSLQRIWLKPSWLTI
jgi:hypothetical protein